MNYIKSGKDKQSDNLQLIVYGTNGVGKSWLIGSALEVYKKCAVILSDTSTTYSHHFPEFDRFEIDPVENIIMQYGLIKPHLKNYDFIAIDQASSLCDYSFLQESKLTGNSKKAWQTMFNGMVDFMFYLQGVCPDYACICLRREEKNSDGVINGVGPLLQGNSFPQKMGSFFNVMGHLDVKQIGRGKMIKIERRLIIKPDGFSVVRDSFHHLEDMEDPTIAKIWQQIKGGKE